MEEEHLDVDIAKERVLEEVSSLGFPVETLLKELESVSNNWAEVWISKFTEHMLEVYKNNPDLESMVKKCKEDAVEIFKDLVKLRGENLRDYLNAYDIFHDGFEESDDDEEEKEKRITNTTQTIDEIYTEEKDVEVDSQLKELLIKKSQCLELRKKLSELKFLNTTYDDTVNRLKN